MSRFPSVFPSGITSACAEKSLDNLVAGRREGNYLRMRGEEFSSRRTGPKLPELPPHARRRGLNLLTVANMTWNYLRMRGEETPLAQRRGRATELPPHARRRA